MAALAQEVLLHDERCMRHEDVVQKILPAGLNRTLDEWLCDSFAELIEEMELWNQRRLVETSKITAAEQHISHKGRAVGHQTSINANDRKNELGCSN